MSNKRYIILGLVFTFSIGCASSKIKWRDWRNLPNEHYAIPPYAKYLSQFKIALDPGHGGMSQLPGYKRGPSGKREAIMNLTVARYLKEFLEKAGARVVLTRNEDRFVSLQDRVQIAEQAGSQLLVSIHHNVSGNPETNFTAVFYHQQPDSSPVSLDLARNIYFGLVEALHLPQISEEGLLSDQYIYPSGFGLLRRARIPAVLLESSFYSNPKEEKRLMKKAYNRREAYGIFLGLARWAAGGLPEARLLQPEKISREKKPRIVYELFDGLRQRQPQKNRPLLIYSESASLKIDGQIVNPAIDLPGRRLIYQPDSALTNGSHLLQVQLQNIFKNHNLPRVDTLIVAAPTDSIRFIVPVDSLPTDGATLMPIRFALFDADHKPVWKGTPISLFADRGKVIPEHLLADTNEVAIFYKPPQDRPGISHIVATADGYSDTLKIYLTRDGKENILSGLVMDDSTRTGIHNASITINDSIWAFTDSNGAFFLRGVPAGSSRVSLKAPGYFPDLQEVYLDSTHSLLITSRLKPIFSGLLHDETFILDAALGGETTGDRFENGISAAEANLALSKSLANRLRWAGAEVILVRDTQDGLSIPERIEKVNQIPTGWYLKILYRKWDSDSVLVQSTIYPANREGERMAKSIHGAFSQFPGIRTLLLQNTEVPEVTQTNKTAVELAIFCKSPRVQTREMPAILAGIVAFLKQEKQPRKIN